MRGDEHQIDRYFSRTDVLGYMQHYVQCSCGGKFRGHNSKDVMAKQFRHAWAKTQENRSG